MPLALVLTLSSVIFIGFLQETWIFHNTVVFYGFLFFFISEHRITAFTLSFTSYHKKIVLSYEVQSLGVKSVYRTLGM